MAVTPRFDGAIVLMQQQGSLVCVGVGMMLGAHLTPRARHCIESAQVLFAAVSDALVQQWLLDMNPRLISLQSHYAPGKSRHLTYREMREAILTSVREGNSVCAAFYGHPGVFATVPHAAIAQARTEGFVASMEPGISAADCLFADLGIDPGQWGCQHYEASQLMLYRRAIDRSAYLILWQAGVAGDRSYRRFSTSAAHLSILRDVLREWYPATHPLIIYEAATLPIQQPRVQTIALDDLPGMQLSMHSTLVLAPAQPLQDCQAVQQRLALLEQQLAANVSTL